MTRKLMLIMAVCLLAVAFGAYPGVTTSSANTMPSGQRMYGNTSFDTTTGEFTGGGGTIEPAYDDVTGKLVYLQTPNNAHVHPNTHNIAPLYLPIYPAGSGIDPSTLNCAHMPADNCPDHGPLVSQIAINTVPSVYHAGGVLGHDHLVGIAKSGGDFNVLWEPVLVLFNSVAASQQHLTTDAQIDQLNNTGQITEVPLPQADFHCSVVSVSTYNKATPAPTVVGP